VRVLHVTGVYPPADFYTGPLRQLHRLAGEQQVAGIDVRVVTTNANGPQTLAVPAGRWTEFEGIPVFYGRRLPGTDQLSWGAWRALAREAAHVDLIHVTALFNWPIVAAAASARRVGVRVIVSPRGSLDPEALVFSAKTKAWFFRFGGARALKEAAAFHVTSEMEREYVEAFVPGARTGLVPNGVTVPTDDDLTRWTSAPAAAPTVLFLGRIHPKKNLIPLVRAWAAVAPRHPDAKLVLAGPDDHGHRAEVERTVDAVGVAGSVRLVGPVGGEALSRLLANAVCLVLPSTTENFGNVVAEALAHRVPVIASTGTPWRGLHDRDCGWWIQPSIEGLAAAICDALATSAAGLAAKGDRGRRWMIEEFSWRTVARRMGDFYLDVVSRR
jgi:glycosyltransferase involved in cell wall biosynthesis